MISRSTYCCSVIINRGGYWEGERGGWSTCNALRLSMVCVVGRKPAGLQGTSAIDLLLSRLSLMACE